MDRRQFLGGTCGAAIALQAGAAPAWAGPLPVPPGNAIAFAVLRNGGKIGEHHLSFTQTGDDLAIEINVELLVTMAMIPVFRYSLQATERWSGGVFQSVHSQVNDNGDQIEMQAVKTADGYLVQGVNHDNPAKTKAPYTTPPNTMPLTYWNRQMLYGTIVNIQTAHSYPAIVNSPGWNKLPAAGGGEILAQRFDVTGKLHLSVWYDQNNQWSGLEFHLSGDETYQKIIS